MPQQFMSEWILYLSFWFCVTSLRVMFSRSIHLPANFKMSLIFFHRVVLQCVNVPHLLYPFFSQGAFRLLPGSDYDQ